MASETPDLPVSSSSARPFLRNSHSDENPTNTSLRTLEDGDNSVFGSDIEEEIRPRPGLWKRLRMSIRRRNGKARFDDGFESVRLLDEKKSAKKWRVKRKHAARVCIIVPLLVVIFL
jgi:hypothetical protein